MVREFFEQAAKCLTQSSEIARKARSGKKETQGKAKLQICVSMSAPQKHRLRSSRKDGKRREPGRRVTYFRGCWKPCGLRDSWGSSLREERRRARRLGAVRYTPDRSLPCR